MTLKKVPAGAAPAATQPVPVIVEPRAGYTDQDVVSRLAALDAAAVTVVAPGFISAELAPAAFPSVESVATVSPKARKQTR
jgi:hypothetical protein